MRSTVLIAVSSLRRPRISLGREGGVLGRAPALLQDLDHAIQVFGAEQRIGVEPQAREDLGAIDPVGRDGQVLELAVAADEPMNAIGVELDDDVLENAGLARTRLSSRSSRTTAGAGDLDHQLRRTDDVTLVDSGSDRRAPAESAGGRRAAPRQSDRG